MKSEPDWKTHGCYSSLPLYDLVEVASAQRLALLTREDQVIEPDRAKLPQMATELYDDASRDCHVPDAGARLRRTGDQLARRQFADRPKHSNGPVPKPESTHDLGLWAAR